jgi:uncharacterized protein
VTVRSVRVVGIAGLVLAGAFALTPGSAGAAPASSAAKAGSAAAATHQGPAIQWREWSRAAFDEARNTRRLVLLDITASWCHWCRVMADESYADSSVITEINTDYIPIRVDYDLRPDIGDRYLTNGWPTTSVLSTNGQVLVQKTYLPAGDLRRFLSETVHFSRVNHAQVERKVAEAEKAVERTWEPDSLLPPSLSEEEYIQQNIEALRAAEDKEHGGFGIAPKTAHWDAISFLLRAADAKHDDSIRALAVRGAAAALALQDSIDGGFFHFALAPDWTKIRYERLLDDQAAALSVLTRVYRATGEERFRRAADAVQRFGMRMTEGDGASRGANPLYWRQSMGPDVPTAGGWTDGDVYFRLSRATRLRQGRPPLSRTTTADATARFLSALDARDRFERSPLTSDRRASELAKLRTRLATGDGSLYHAEAERVRSAPGLLADQAAVGNALLDGYEAEGSVLRGRFLAESDTVAAWLVAKLEDPLGGGFRYAPRDTAAVGRLRAGDKPEAANVEAGMFFLRRYWLKGRAEDRAVAERTARYLQSGDKINLDPARAELVLRLREEPVRLLVVSGKGRGGSRLYESLRVAALTAPVPEVVVRYLETPPREGRPIGWPDGPPPNAHSPAIYRWTATGWRGPVTDPSKLGDILDKPVIQP